MTEEYGVNADSAETFQDEDREDSFQEGIEKITGVLDEAADKLYALAESLEVTGKEPEEINAGKTQEEIDGEEALADQIAGPVVDALDTAAAEINGVTKKILEMTGDFLSDIFTKKG